MIYVHTNSDEPQIQIDDKMGARLCREHEGRMQFWDGAASDWSDNPSVPPVPLIPNPEADGTVSWRRSIEAWPSHYPMMSVDIIHPTLGVINSNAVMERRHLFVSSPIVVVIQ